MIKETLIKARAKVEAGWIQKSFAADSEGKDIELTSPGACAFCAVGAIASVGVFVPEAMGALNFVINARSITDWNDAPGRTQQEVLDAFDRAIASA